MPVIGTVGEKVFEMKDVLHWLEEEAEAKGELGWSDNFPDKAEIFAESVIFKAPSPRFYDNENFPDEDEVDRMRAELREESLQRREIAKRQGYMFMNTMRPLMVHTERELDKSLSIYGVSKPHIAQKSLRQKVVDLKNLVNPHVKNYIRVWVDACPTTGYRRMLPAKLPIKEDLCQIYSLLKTAVDINIAGSGMKQEKGGLWKYQLVSYDLKRVVNKTSVYLKSDEDYRTLVDTVKAVNEIGKRPPVAILTQDKAKGIDNFNRTTCTECSQKGEIAGKEMFGYQERAREKSEDEDLNWDDSKWDMPLDEDGNPYFDPYDPERIRKIVVKRLERDVEDGNSAIEDDLLVWPIGSDK